MKPKTDERATGLQIDERRLIDLLATAEKRDSDGTTVLDMSEDDPNHFHPDYFGKAYRWYDPQVDNMIVAYEEGRRLTGVFQHRRGHVLGVRRALWRGFPAGSKVYVWRQTLVLDASAPRSQKRLSRVAPDPMAKSQVPLMQMAKYSLHYLVADYLQRRHPAIARIVRSAVFRLCSALAAFRRWTL